MLFRPLIISQMITEFTSWEFDLMPYEKLGESKNQCDMYRVFGVKHWQVTFLIYQTTETSSHYIGINKTLKDFNDFHINDFNINTSIKLAMEAGNIFLNNREISEKGFFIQIIWAELRQ